MNIVMRQGWIALGVSIAAMIGKSFSYRYRYFSNQSWAFRISLGDLFKFLLRMLVIIKYRYR
jgi:hypothetical protein